ncbi:MAG: hypothetical protein Q8P25_00765 [Candidatus Curtissbacteria bacterium]|nr:hypothetical protein [Candidatus Curtissbacteria bacterium]
MKILLFRNRLRPKNQVAFGWVEYPPRIQPRRKGRKGLSFLVFLLIFTILLNALSFNESLFDMVPRLGSLASWGKIETVTDTFGNGSQPEFYLRSENKVSTLDRIFSLGRVEAAEPKAEASILDYAGHEVLDIKPEIASEDSGFKVTLSNISGVKPGKYTLSAKWTDATGANYVSTQDFRWGTLAINTNKSIYLPGEEAKLGFGVLNDQGKAVCDARLKLQVTSDKLQVREELSTENGGIKPSGKCGPQNITNSADYTAVFKVQGTGLYKLDLIVESKEGKRSTTSYFEVKESVPFDIERTSYPTRIYQPSPYDVKLTVVANQDFRGQITETLPASFSPTGYSATVVEGRESVVGFTEVGYQRLLTWTVDWKKGEVHELTYFLKAQDIYPQFYLVEPIKFIKEGKLVFDESKNAGWLVQAAYNFPDIPNVTVGGNDSKKLKPEVLVSNWDGEASMKISYPVGADAVVQTGNNAISWKDLKQDLYFKKITEPGSAKNGSSGKFEFDLLLKEKPESNVFAYDINSKNLDFFYQPALNEENKDPELTCTLTECRDKENHITIFRPENVVGSYAVYYKDGKSGDYSQLGGKNYKTGKALHIYRPKITDANNNSTWGNLNVDTVKGELTVTVDQNWLAQAQYPVTVDPTFGYETAGGTEEIADLYAYGAATRGSLFTGAAGTATKITAYTKRLTAGNAKGGIYTHSDSTLITNGATNEVSVGTSYSWVDFAFATSPTIEAVDYVLALAHAYAKFVNAYYKYDTGSADQGHSQANAYLTSPATFTHTTNKYSIYATYTEGGDPVPEYSILLAPFAFGIPKIIRSIRQGTLSIFPPSLKFWRASNFQFSMWFLRILGFNRLRKVLGRRRRKNGG